MLETTALACERGGLRLFSDLDFALERGGLLRVNGGNGSGKTTLLRTLAGLTRPAAGAVRWKGSDIDERYWSELLFLGHAPALKDEFTVLENLAFSAQLSDQEFTEESLRKALAQLGIARLAQLPAGHLSQGQRRRTALARLALPETALLWLLDEPFAALDGEAIGCVSALCAAHLAAGGLLVLTSHQEVPIAATAVQILELPAAAFIELAG